MTTWRLAYIVGLVILLPGLADAQPQLCLVVGVSDGDTITARCGTPGVYDQIKVRLSAIDAPESKQAFGQRSKQALSALCYMTEATITPKTKDRYGRTVADVQCRGQDAARHMVAGGWAWYYTRYGKGYEHLAGIEAEARAARRGLWVEPGAVEPWEWRKRPKNQHQHVTIMETVEKNSEKSGIWTKLS